MEILKKVSVIMCTFNGEKYLKEQLDSILSQTYPLYEIIIRDDCSTDNTWNILQEYQFQYPGQIQCFQNEKNLGYLINFRLTMLQTKGDYIAFSDQDDSWMSNKIEYLIDLIGEKLLAISNSKIVDELFLDGITLYQLSNPNEMTIEKLIWNNAIYGHACLINASILNYIKRVKVESAHDYSIALIGFTLNSVVITNEVLQIWRRHPLAVTSAYTTSFSEKNKIKGYNKTLYSISCLILGKKSKVIGDGFDKINHILSLLVEENNTAINLKVLIDLTKLMKRQSLFSYIKASFICWKLKDVMFENKSVEFKNRILLFSFVYRWWYDHRFDMS